MDKGSSFKIQDLPRFQQQRPNVQPTRTANVKPDDGNQVLDFLRSNDYTEQVWTPESERVSVGRIQDTMQPQTTNDALQLDGIDIINYLKQVRYHQDMNSDQEYEIQQAIAAYESAVDAKDEQHARSALDRLRLLMGHFTK